MRVIQIKYVRTIFICIWFVGLVSLAATAHADGLTEVEQTIFGMDCAPCAYGIEQGLKKLPGVTGVRVSLNEGLAAVTLAANNSTTLENIRKIVRDNGFTPKNARVTLVGTLLRADGGEWLEASGLPRYRLTARDEAVAAALRARPNGETVRIEGEVPEAAAVADELKVMQLQSL
jgi:copper chaperone CopZ